MIEVTMYRTDDERLVLKIPWRHALFARKTVQAARKMVVTSEKYQPMLHVKAGVFQWTEHLDDEG